MVNENIRGRLISLTNQIAGVKKTGWPSKVDYKILELLNRKKIMISKRFTALLLAIALVCLCSANLWAKKPSKVAILPFKINSAEDLSFLQNGIVDMLTTRLSWKDKVAIIEKKHVENALAETAGPINEEVARQLGTHLEADYVLFGSLTIFGKSVSIDAKMIDVHGVESPVTIFNQSHGMDTVIPKINFFAADINKKVFGRIPQKPQQIPRETPQPQTTPGIYAHPEKILGGSTEMSQETSGLNPGFVAAAGSKDTTSFWKSRNFKEYIKAIAMGDVDGNGNKEFVFISQNKIFIYRNIERRFVKVKEIAGKPYQKFVSMDVADINNNGKAEIFVTNLNTVSKVLDSFVLEWNAGDFVPISKENNWYYRVLDMPARGTILLGQKRGISDPFLPGIHELAWRGGNYEPVNNVKVPRGINVFSFTMGDIMGDGGEAIVALNDDDYIQIFTMAGASEWKSDEHFGGSVNYLDVKSTSGDMEDERLYLAQRIFIKDLDKNGKNEVVVVKNHSATSRLFERFRHYSSSEIVALSWDGLGLAVNWKTRKINGYVSDFILGDFDNDGEQELVAAVVMQKGSSFITKPKSAIISYDLATPES